MKKIFALLLTFNGAILCCLSQQSGNNPAKAITYNQQAEINSQKQIIELKRGSLIFLLSDNSASVEALRKSGNEEAAVQLQKESALRNKKLKDAFKISFNFCPVLFAYKSELKGLQDHNYENKFLNDSLIPDPTIRLATDYFLFADLGPVYTETAGFVNGQTDSSFTEEGQAFRNQSLVIKDFNMKQLKHPFPYFVDCSNLDAANKKVRKLNQNLIRYYQSVNQEK